MVSERSRCIRRACLPVLVIGVAACESSAPPPDEVRPVATVREVMADMIAPSADVLWGAIQTVSTPDGYEDQGPQTDEEWARLRHGATTMVESANLLLTEGRLMAPPGATSGAPGVELEPDSISALVSARRAEWVEFAHALQESGQTFVQAIDAKNGAPLLDAGDALNTACENCHEAFWYPTNN
jgi:hypothetical protein